MLDGGRGDRVPNADGDDRGGGVVAVADLPEFAGFAEFAEFFDPGLGVWGGGVAVVICGGVLPLRSIEAFHNG